MTIWHTLGSYAGTVPGLGTLLGAIQRLGGNDQEIGDRDDAPSPTESIKFTIAIIALSAKLARSDGAVTIDEVEMFRRIMSVSQEEETNVRRLFDLAKQDVAGFESYAQQIGKLLEDDTVLRREVVDGLFAIAAADGVLHEREDVYLRTVAGLIGVTPASYEHLRGLYFAVPMGPYDTLGLTPDATDAEIKARHRSLVKEHHPDRLAGLGCCPTFIAKAEERLASVNAAFDVIARERGF